MKISKLIEEITNLAEVKFGISVHGNDGITVAIDYIITFYDSYWQVCLERPSQRQLDCGEVNRGIFTKKWETCRAFHIKAKTLLEALNNLHDEIIITTEEFKAR